MRPQTVFLYRILPVAFLSTALLLFSVHHLLKRAEAAADSYGLEAAAADAGQDLGMPPPPPRSAFDRASVAARAAAEVAAHDDDDGGALDDAWRLEDLPPPSSAVRAEASTREGRHAAAAPATTTTKATGKKWRQSSGLGSPAGALGDGARPATVRLAVQASMAGARSGGGGAASKGQKVILLWTSWFGQSMWWFKPGAASFAENKCPVQDCYATNDRSYASSAHVVLFQASRVVYKVDKKTLGYDIPVNYTRPRAQIWALATRESPLNTYSGDQLAPLNGLMNVTMTYKRDSDIVFPFSHKHVLHGRPTPKQQYGVHRKKLALWFVSNCRPRSKRLMLAQELQRLVGGRIDIFGRCSNRTNPCGPGSSGDCEKAVVPQYKFYLAFENSICRDYITEKFFHKLYKGAVPVVYGTTQADYDAMAPPDSYLHVDNFTSVAALAAHMLRLDADDEAYDAYHRWRERYDVVTPYGTGSVWGDFVCRSCQLAHDGVPPARRGNPRRDLSTWFSARDCKVVVEKP